MASGLVASCTLLLLLGAGALVLATARRHGWAWPWLLQLGLLLTLLVVQLAGTLRSAHGAAGPGLAGTATLLACSALLLLALIGAMNVAPRKPDGTREVAHQLAASERQYRFLVERIPEAFVVVVDGKLAFANRAFKRIFGVTTDEVLGRPFEAFLPLSQEASQTAESDAASTWSSRWVELEIQHSSGARRWVEVRLQLAEWEGRPAQVGLIADITARRRAEDAVRESEARFHSFFDNATIGFYRTTPEGRVLLANPALLRMLGGISFEELTSWDLEATLYRDAFTRKAFLERIERDGEVRGFEAIWSTAQGKPIVVVENAKAIRDSSGRVVYHDGSVEDITERKTLEERLHQLERVEAIGQLAGGIAHDFNNMLLAIRGSAELLLRRAPQGSPSLSELETIQRASLRAAELTRHLLAFARRQVLEPQYLDLNDVIQDMLPVLKRLIPENVEILFWPSRPLSTVNVDRGQLEQVLMNLCINARDAMPAGGNLSLKTGDVQIGVEYVQDHPWARSGSFVLLTVQDTGTGMDSATLAHVFEPFFTTKAPGQGTGLGLATVYGIIKQHGGMIDVESQPGLGTTFQVFLPGVEGPPQSVTARKSLESSGGDETVLVVDDEPEVRRTLREVLGGFGYRVLESGDGASALVKIQDLGREIDLVITDVVMPQMGGVELCAAARTIRPDLRFLFSTGYSETAVDEELLGAPGTFFLAKPYGIDDLAQKVREALDTEGGR